MNAYLQIAEEILRSARKPLTARAILRHAYARDLVPYFLHGKTQHKTLQARLSEDILHRKKQSRFFRTKPGLFFLREFLDDMSVPAEYRKEIRARRRTRDLLLGPALTIKYQHACEFLQEGQFAEPDLIKRIAESGHYHYCDPKHQGDDEVLLWAVSAVMRAGKVLSYRVGKYRDNRDAFTEKRSIAFTTLVSDSSHTLFDEGTLGVADSGFHAVATDLDIPLPEATSASSEFKHLLQFVSWQKEVFKKDSLFAFVEVLAPDWFEPTSGRLSLNDLCWLDMSVPPNNWDDFDPWSRTILSYYFPRPAMHG